MSPATAFRRGFLYASLLWCVILQVRESSFLREDTTTYSDGHGVDGIPMIMHVPGSLDKNNNNNNSLGSGIFASIVGGGDTTCDQVQNLVDVNTWKDPNKGKWFVRQVITEPHFFISVHAQEYDPLRYKYIFNTGDYYETDVRKRFEYILAEHRYEDTPIVLDMGGNIGYYTLLSAAWNHSVITFEVNPANVIRLCESIRFNRFTEKIRIHRTGVSNTSGQLLEIEVGTNPGQVGIDDDPSHQLVKDDPKKAAPHAKAETHKFMVTTMMFDDFVHERGWYDRDDINISLWKLDTEGHELQILLGSRRFIQSRMAKNILVEYRSRVRPATELLLDSGYAKIGRAHV